MIRHNRVGADLADHCNLACDHCGQHSPFLGQKFYALDRFKEDVDALAKVMHVSRFDLVGGEPLLNPQILAYAGHVKGSGFADRITLITNGILLGKCDPALFGSITDVEVSLYPLSASVQERVRESIRALRSAHPHVRVTLHHQNSFVGTELFQKIDDKVLVREIFRRCYRKSSCNHIYEGYFFRCAATRHIPQFLNAFGIVDANYLNDAGIDRVFLGSANLEERLVRFISSKDPLRSCSWCLGTSGKRQAHRQVNPALVREKQDKAKTFQDPWQLVDFQRPHS
jgi:hypothetical protein